MIDRRNFLKLSALGGLAMTCPLVVRDGRAQVGRYDGPFWVLVNANGGWDPRFLFDPVANGTQNRLYAAPGIVGNIPCADFAIDTAAFNLDTTQGYEAYLLSPRAFLERHGARLTVINGIDTSTNNHEAGSRTTWSGTIPGEYPSFGALVAAAKASTQPMAFISGGGYDFTANLVPLARVTNPDTLAKITLPNVTNPEDLASDRYHTDETMARIAAAQAERLQALRDRERLPRVRAALDELAAARAGVGELSRLELPEALVDIPGGQLDDLERMLRQAQLAVAAFKSGMAVSATLDIGGFDTHSDHDRDQPRQVAKLLAGLDYLIAQATAAGLADRMYIVVGSDFARGPEYNSDRDNAGKDHWPITSMLAMGPNIPGNRVVGSTSLDQRAVPVDPNSLTPLPDGGVKLTPEVVHKALRRVAGVEDLGADFPLTGPDLNLFG